MNVLRRRVDLLGCAAIGLAVLWGLLLWPRLPAEMAIHFDASSTPDDFVSKPVGVLLAPAIGLAAVLLVRRGGELGGGPTHLAVEAAAVGFVGVVVGCVHALVLAWNVGFRFDVTVSVLPVLGLAVLLVVNAMYREGRLPTCSPGLADPRGPAGAHAPTVPGRPVAIAPHRSTRRCRDVSPVRA